MSERAQGSVGTPVGELIVTCTGGGVAGVRYGRPGRAAQRGAAAQDAAQDQLAAACAQLAGYFAGRLRSFGLPVDWAAVPPAQRQVLEVLAGSVGYGETVTYGELARRAGLPDGGSVPAARVVGQIMGSNPVPIVVPCHRVVASGGLGGYSGGAGTEVKRWLLIFEGALPPTLDWDPAGPVPGAAAAPPHNLTQAE